MSNPKKKEILDILVKKMNILGLVWDDKWNCYTDYEGGTFDPYDCTIDCLKVLGEIGITIHPEPTGATLIEPWWQDACWVNISCEELFCRDCMAFVEELIEAERVVGWC